MRLLSLIALFSLGAFVSIGCQPNTEWKEYTSEEGKYTILMPGDVEKKNSTFHLMKRTK